MSKTSDRRTRVHPDTNLPLHKVLLEGQSFHGGNMAWSLPVQSSNGNWKPGRWHTDDLDRNGGRVFVCQNGLHLTSHPMRWAGIGMRIYTAEGAGKRDNMSDKVAFESARLLEDVTDKVSSVPWKAAEAVADEIKTGTWFVPTGEPDPNWVMHENHSVYFDREASEPIYCDDMLPYARQLHIYDEVSQAWSGMYDVARAVGNRTLRELEPYNRLDHGDVAYNFAKVVAYYTSACMIRAAGYPTGEYDLTRCKRAMERAEKMMAVYRAGYTIVGYAAVTTRGDQELHSLIHVARRPYLASVMPPMVEFDPNVVTPPTRSH